MADILDLSEVGNEGRKIYIDVVEQDGAEIIHCDWTIAENGGFRNAGEVLHILASALAMVQKVMMETEVQKRPFVGTPNWIKRK